MAGKSGKFANVLSASTPSLSGASKKTMVLQNIIEGDKPEYQYIKIDSIELNPLNDYNVADSEDDIRQLAEDIRRNGLLHNIVVSYTDTGIYRLLSGERRLRAYRLLFDETHDSKYSSIYSLIRKGLSDVEEMIILDAANLNARNSTGDEKRYRKATARFVDNLKSKYSISDEEAVFITKQYASVQGTVIEKNIILEKDLHPALLALLDSEHISKAQAYEYARLSQDVQNVIAEGLVSAKEKSASDLKKLNSDISGPAKNIRILDESLSSQKSELDRISKEEKEAKKKLAKAQGAESRDLQRTLEDLKNQKKEQKRVIQNTQEAKEEAIESLQDQVASNQESSHPVATIGIGASIALKALEQLNILKKSINQLSSIGIEDKIEYFAEPDKNMLYNKLKEYAKELDLLADKLK